MNVKIKTALLAVCALGMGISNHASAFEPGDFLVRVGASYVNPQSDNHPVVDVESAASASINFTYMMTDIWAIEVLAAYPFKHDIELVGGDKVGSTKHLPPTVNLQYHFNPEKKFQPYVGFGLNYTTFFSEKTTGALAGTSLKLGDSWGLGGQIGFDVMLSDSMFLNFDARYIKIETKAKLDGLSIGTVEINPWVYGAHIGFKF